MIRILAYHRIALGDSPLCVPPSRFRRQLSALERLRFTLVDLRELDRFLDEPRRSTRLAALTFDDGSLDNYTVAFPTLLEREASATFFVPSAQVGTAGKMTLEHLREMVEAGFEIGSHGRTHRELPGLSDEEVDVEVRGSKEDLEDALGVPIESFAYPRGHFDRRAVEAVQKAGYLRAVVTPRGPGHEPSRYTMERVGIYGHTGLGAFVLKVTGVYGQIKRLGWVDRS